MDLRISQKSLKKSCEGSFCGGGDYSVSEEPQSVQPTGKPIIVSTNAGFNGPGLPSSPLRALASSVLLCWLEPFRRNESSFAHGVGKDEYPSTFVARANFRR